MQGAPKGNQFWRLRAKSGCGFKYSDVQEFKDACFEYFEHCESNPIKEQVVNFYQGEPFTTYLEHQRVKTIGGLCVFLGIAHRTWVEWRNVRKDDEKFMEVFLMVEEIIREDKFTGAVAGIYSTNIIARDLGLADKTMQELSGSVAIERIERVIIKPNE
jgi:hypothetical protein